MAEASVLHATAVEIFLLVASQREGGFVFFELEVARLLQHFAFAVFHAEESGAAVDADGQTRCGDDEVCVGSLELELEARLTGIFYENLCFGFSLRIADDAALIVLEEPEDVFAIEIEGEMRVVVEINFHGVGVVLLHFHGACSRSVSDFCGRGCCYVRMCGIAHAHAHHGTSHDS